MIYASQDDLVRRFGFSDSHPGVSAWHTFDTQALFHKNLRDPSTAAMLADLGWLETGIEYRMNDHGFRTDDDFATTHPGSGNMFLGCSLTLGEGLNVEDTWAYMLNQRLGGKFHNMGQSGRGIETQYRLLKAWGPRLRPHRAYTLGSFMPRREFITGPRRAAMVSPWSTGDEKRLLERFLADENETDISFLRTIDAMRGVCTENKIELHAPGPAFKEWWKNAVAGYRSTARDLLHFGRDFHAELAAQPDGFWSRLA